MPAGTMKRVYKAPRKSNLRRVIQRVIDKNLEKKFNYTLLTNQLVANTGTNFDISQVAVGDSQLTRTGNQCRITGMYGQFTITPNGSTLLANPVIYVYIVRVLIYIPKEATDTITTLAFNAECDPDKYNVLIDKSYPVTFSGGVYAPRYKKSFKFKGTAGMVTQYHGASANNISKNPIRMFIVSDASAPSEQPYMSGHIKCFFTDA